jgi:hypothetical protein
MHLPLLRARMGFPATPLRRVGLGFFVCAITMAESGFIEIWRKASPVTTEMSSCTEIPMKCVKLLRSTVYAQPWRPLHLMI